jgi:hypothetical protein
MVMRAQHAIGEAVSTPYTSPVPLTAVHFTSQKAVGQKIAFICARVWSRGVVFVNNSKMFDIQR